MRVATAGHEIAARAPGRPAGGGPRLDATLDDEHEGPAGTEEAHRRRPPRTRAKLRLERWRPWIPMPAPQQRQRNCRAAARAQRGTWTPRGRLAQNR